MKRTLQHIALIMDGNRRWAKKRGLSKLEGHRHGYGRIEEVVNQSIELQIKYLTFWAFSTENWRREKSEVEYLLDLFREQFNKKVAEFHRRNVRVNVIGNLAMFPPDIQRQTKSWIGKTKNNKKITVNLALSYGGRDELLRAISKWHASSRLKAQGSRKITEEEFEQYLDTAGQPDPELVIRTGGRRRLSGFLAWQSVYSELYFTDILWPDFTVEKFDKAIEWYKEQKRNFGR